MTRRLGDTETPISQALTPDACCTDAAGISHKTLTITHLCATEKNLVTKITGGNIAEGDILTIFVRQ